MVCFVPSVCLSIRKSCQRRDCSELGNIRNWVEHCTTSSLLFSLVKVVIIIDLEQKQKSAYYAENTTDLPKTI